MMIIITNFYIIIIVIIIIIAIIVMKKKKKNWKRKVKQKKVGHCSKAAAGSCYTYAPKFLKSSTFSLLSHNKQSIHWLSDDDGLPA